MVETNCRKNIDHSSNRKVGKANCSKNIDHSSKRNVVETNCNKNMVLLLNYSKGKVEKANCSKSKWVEKNCSKNIDHSSKRKVVEANCSKKKVGKTARTWTTAASELVLGYLDVTHQLLCEDMGFLIHSRQDSVVTDQVGPVNFRDREVVEDPSHH